MWGRELWAKRRHDPVSQGHSHLLCVGSVPYLHTHIPSTRGGSNSPVGLPCTTSTGAPALESAPRAKCLPLKTSSHLFLYSWEGFYLGRLGPTDVILSTRLWPSLAARREDRENGKMEGKSHIGSHLGLNYCMTLSQSPPLSGNVSSSVTWENQDSSCSDIPSSTSPQTTIMAVEFDGGVVVGSDSRVSVG